MNPFLMNSFLTNPFLLSSSSPNNPSHLSVATDDKAETRSPAPRVLVVDDEKVIADTIVQILNRNGFIAEAAYGGEEAIEKAGRHCPEVVLSDVLMPQIDGVEAAIATFRQRMESMLKTVGDHAGTLRAPSFKGLRDDVDSADVRRDPGT